VPGGGAAAVALIALAPRRLPDPLPVSRTQHGMPDEGDGPAAIALVARERAADPTWFAREITGRFTELIAADLGPDAAAAALAAEHAYVIEATLHDPDDLGHLQAAWALAKCVCEEGAVVVVDVYAARAHLGASVAALAPERALDVMHEVTLFFEELDDGPHAGTLAAWSLGLCKFGRPDLVLIGVAPDRATEAAILLSDVAALLADGERVEPGDEIEAPAAGAELFASSLRAAAFEPERWPQVGVDGPAILLSAT
jgi:hypothetical protein